ncbi:MAG: DEAD/DEAH box helicase family protein [Patescibacteria group bacterium]|jgi:superfamily II DNA or RNA helicase
MNFHPPAAWWPSLPPRRWQAEALPTIVLALEGQHPTPCVVQAVMGSGKSVLIAELVAQAVLETHEVVIITTSTQRLVEQLAETISARLGTKVGRYYANAKEPRNRVIVACIDSAENLALALAGRGPSSGVSDSAENLAAALASRTCVLWIADEAHRTECDTMHRAHSSLRPNACIGFTATPYRSSSTEELSLFHSVVYEYGPRDALQDHVIVPWRVVPWTAGQVSADEACLDLVRGAEGQGVVNAVDIKDAEFFAGLLRSNGISAEAIHSQLPAGVGTQRIEALRVGALKALVHVSMLQEGVDLPWLRWLCLRRPSASKVRFAQEVGRVLRSFPGKPFATIYDPHDLFASFKLSYDAVLCGQAEESTATPELMLSRVSPGVWRPDQNPLIAGVGSHVLVRLHLPNRPTPRIVAAVRRVGPDEVVFDEDHFPDATAIVAKVTIEGLTADEIAAQVVLCLPVSALEKVDATVLEAVSAYLRKTTIELELAGLIDRKVASKSWRSQPRTSKQWGFLERLLSGVRKRADLVPEPHRSALRHACRAAHLFTRGQLSDLLEVLLAIVGHHEWPLAKSKDAA